MKESYYLFTPSVKLSQNQTSNNFSLNTNVVDPTDEVFYLNDHVYDISYDLKFV